MPKNTWKRLFFGSLGTRAAMSQRQLRDRERPRSTIPTTGPPNKRLITTIPSKAPLPHDEDQPA